MKLVLRVLKTGLRNQKNLIFKNRLRHLKQKCFSVLRQKQSCSHGVKNGCKNLQRFGFNPLKPFCLSSEQGLRVINIGYSHKCLSFELQIGDKICNFVALYRSPSQSQDDFETFADNFEMTLNF